MSRAVVINELPTCDMDGCEEKALYDAATKMGPWGYMCPRHYSKFGRGLGTGRGQKLFTEEEEKEEFLRELNRINYQGREIAQLRGLHSFSFQSTKPTPHGAAWDCGGCGSPQDAEADMYVLACKDKNDRQTEVFVCEDCMQAIMETGQKQEVTVDEEEMKKRAKREMDDMENLKEEGDDETEINL